MLSSLLLLLTYCAGVPGVRMMAPQQACWSSTVTLQGGIDMPLLAFGTGTSWFRSENRGNDDLLRASVLQALREGVRHLDCAEMYGTEADAGRALKAFLEEEDGLKRHDIFVTSKAWDSIKAGNVTDAVEESLAKLQLEYIDLYLLHAPFIAEDGSGLAEAEEDSDAFRKIFHAWRELEALVDDGRIRSIGVSNFRAADLRKLLDYARIPPVVNQVEGHPQLLQPLLRDFCRENDIQLVHYSPLASIGEDWLVEGVKDIAQRLDTSTAGVLLAWTLRTGAGFITTSKRRERVAEALLSFQVVPRLSDADMSQISRLGSDRPYRKFWVPNYGDNFFG